MENILDSIKKLLGIEKEYNHFDDELVIFINAAFSSLLQIGVGLDKGFMITDKSETWFDLFGDTTDIESIKLYTYFKVRIGFDPPTNAFVIDAMERQMKEIEWRTNVQRGGK